MKRTWYKQGDALLQEIKDTKVNEGELAFWHIGQCGFIYKGDVTLYIDPMLNDHKDEKGVSARHFQAPYSPEEAKADYVICTHDHLDHIAPETIQGIARVSPETKFIIPAYSISVLQELGVPSERILPMKAKETLKLPGLRVTAIATAHPVHQQDENGCDFSLAYLVEMNGIKFLHLGDTYLTDQLLEDLKALPQVDLFFPPVNGGDYFRTARNCIGNINAIEAAELAAILKPDLYVPTHFDMFVGNTVDPLAVIRIFLERNPGCKWHVTTLGARYIYRK